VLVQNDRQRKFSFNLVVAGCCFFFPLLVVFVVPVDELKHTLPYNAKFTDG
jgi:hypothetical protein